MFTTYTKGGERFEDTKKPNYSKGPYPTDKERREWDTFVNLVIAVLALVMGIIVIILKIM
ncbi:hypothetical protein P7H75_05665 [Vagococcus carniphilus]|uniref:hypothetical protein n=1 Tax=Vagococcus carniphilus TaxID=218144 RepID=UPI002891E8DA|nr:hypothetical protein [Vagococcus carniphilus]MDT2814326.1 hypothetical protein [Vagococcus carniphilus]